MEASRPDPDLLQRWIHEEGVAAAEVGARLGLSRAAGYRWLQRYGISSGSAPVGQAELVARWRAGAPADELAAEHRLPVDAVRDRLVAAAAMTANRTYYVLGSAADPLPQDVLRGWYLHDRFSVNQIAALTGMTPRQVRYRLARYHLSGEGPGAPARPRRRLDRRMLAELYDDGLTCAQIGERFGASAESIGELLTAYGIRCRASGRRKRAAPPEPPGPVVAAPEQPGSRGLIWRRAAEAIANARLNVAESRRLVAYSRLCRSSIRVTPGVDKAAQPGTSGA